MPQSLADFYQHNEVCNLPQFQHLSEDECNALEGDGEAYTRALQSARQAASGRNPQATSRDFTEDEVSYLAAFLRTLTDKSAMAGSNEIKALIPPRDGGPDGNQLDAVDQMGNPL